MSNTTAPITVQTIINASVADCWKCWTNPADILKFNNPFDDWHTAKVDIDVKPGGRLYYSMEAKNGSEGFDFGGVYDIIITNERIESTGDDGRKTINTFTADGNKTIVKEIFEPDATTPLDVQTLFCQNILDNFKKYMEEK